jgi:ATP-dependent Clp protease ATP-binding subunit ClpA
VSDSDLLTGLSAIACLAIADALDGAIDLGHDFLGCEHLVLGLAEQTDSTAGQLLRDLGINAESIRRAIPAAVSAAALGYTNAQQLLAPSILNRLDDLTRRLNSLDDRLQASGL